MFKYSEFTNSLFAINDCLQNIRVNWRYVDVAMYYGYCTLDNCNVLKHTRVKAPSKLANMIY